MSVLEVRRKKIPSGDRRKRSLLLDLLFTWEEIFLLKKIVELRLSGWGYYRIGRFLVENGYIRKRSYEAAKKWVMRFIKRAMKRLDLSSEEELYKYIANKCFKPRHRDIGTFFGTTPSTNLDNSFKQWGGGSSEELPSREDLVRLRGDKWEYYARLGRTQKLVLAAFSILERNASPSEILSIIKQYFPTIGARLTRQAVFQAIKRLVKRGLLIPIEYYDRKKKVKVRARGRYTYTYSVPVLVENFRVDGVWVIRKTVTKSPVPLDYALALAAVRGLVKNPESIELKQYLDPGSRTSYEGDLLHKLGVTYIGIYRDKEREAWNIEARIHNPPYKAHPLNINQYRALYIESLIFAKKAIEEILKHVNGYIGT